MFGLEVGFEGATTGVATPGSSFASDETTSRAGTVKPKRSLPQTCRFLVLRPSPNSSFHFRSSARLPRDSDADGVISFRACSKFRHANDRT